MEQTPELKTSPVLLEKLGDLYLAEEKYQEAEAAYRHSDEVATSMQQQIRLNLNLARILAKENKPEEMFEVYESFTRRFPKYPDLKEIYTRLLDLAEELNKPEQKIRLRGELDRLLGKGF